MYRETVTYNGHTVEVEAHPQRYTGKVTRLSPKSEYRIHIGYSTTSTERPWVAIVRQSKGAVPEERWVIWSADGETRIGALPSLTKVMRSLGARHLIHEED